MPRPGTLEHNKKLGDKPFDIIIDFMQNDSQVIDKVNMATKIIDGGMQAKIASNKGDNSAGALTAYILGKLKPICQNILLNYRNS